MNKPKMLLGEDDKAVRNLLSTAMETQGYPYHAVATGAAAILEAASQQPDIIILDLGLPDMDGVAIIEKIRTWSEVPIIVVSARAEDNDKIAALDAGADDYLTKPFSVNELLARLRVTLRRIRYDHALSGGSGSIYRNGDLRIDYAAGIVYFRDVETHLTPMEYKLLCVLARHTGKVLTHHFLLREVWANATPGDTPSLRVFMATLRKKIEPDPANPCYLQTHIGIGYRMLRVPDDTDMGSDPAQPHPVALPPEQ